MMQFGLFSNAKPASLATAPGPNTSFTPCHQNIKNWKVSTLSQNVHFSYMYIKPKLADFIVLHIVSSLLTSETRYKQFSSFVNEKFIVLVSISGFYLTASDGGFVAFFPISFTYIYFH